MGDLFPEPSIENYIIYDNELAKMDFIQFMDFLEMVWDYTLNKLYKPMIFHLCTIIYTEDDLKNL
jgi:hypothetical protein